MSVETNASRHNGRWPVLLILLLYFIIGAAYSITNPILESPDELLNYKNMLYIAEHKTLPVLQPGEFSKAHHPPLYYTIGAAVIGWVPSDNLEALAEQINPFWGYQTYQVSIDNQSQYLRDPELEGWPYHDAALGIHLMRWLSLLMGAGVITAVYTTTRKLVPKEPSLAWGAAALVAFNPMFLFIQGSVHNDALTNLLAALTILRVVVYWQKGPSVKRVAFIGLVAGLGILTKITFLFLGPLVLIALIARSWQDREQKADWWREMLKMLLIGGGIVVLLAGWWFVRNQILYGEPTSMKLQSSIWQPRENAPDWGAAINDLPYLRDSFWGVFGWGQITLPRPVYTVMWLFALVGAVGLGLWAYRYRKRQDVYRASGMLTAVLLIAPLSAFTATFYRMSISASADFGRYLFTTYAVVAPLLLLGFTEWFSLRWRQAATAVLSLLMLALGLVAYFGILRPAYAAPPIYASAEQVNITHQNIIEYPGQATLLGYNLEPDSAIPGEDLEVTLFWEVGGGFDDNHSFFIQLVDQNGDRVAGRDTHGGLGRYPTSAWQSGQIIADTIPIPIPETTAGPTGLLLTQGMWDNDGDLLTTSTDSGTNVLGVVRLAGSQQGAPPSALYQLGDQVSLVGKEIGAETAVPGQTFPITLTWHTHQQPAADYIVFMHLLDDAGNLVQGYDRPPQNGAFPTHLWQPGDTVVDAWQIQLPDDLENGRYHLVTGWYRLDDLSRLPVTAANGEDVPHAAIPLHTFQVQAAGE